MLGAILLGSAGAVAGTSLHGALHGHQVWIGGIAGAAVAMASWLLAERLRLVVFEWFTVALALFLILGGPVVGLLPTPDSYLDFLRGISGGWTDLLSSVPPTKANGSLAALTYLLSWMSTTGGLALLRKVRVPAVAMAGPITGFGVGLLFVPGLSRVSTVQAVSLLALTLALGRYQLVALNLEPDRLIGNTTIARRRSRLLQAGLVMAVAVVAAVFLAPMVPGPNDDERLTLRDRIEPPWVPLDEPSPLASIKSNFQDETQDDVVFIARGDAVPARWAVATLAAFDGTVWTVGDSEIAGRAPFVPIDGLAPPDEHNLSLIAPAPVDIDVEIVSLDGPWIPLGGRLLEITPSTQTDIRFNVRTGTAAVPGGIDELQYTARVIPWPTVPQETLADLEFPQSAGIGLDGQAAGVRDWSADVVEGLDRGWDQVAAIRDELVQGGYLADDRLQPGHSWARLTKFFSDEEFYGNEEQYAAVGGIAGRNAGLATRVVVGYLIEPDKLSDNEVAVTRGEASAWIEVLTSQHGWVPVDVTPPRDNEPSLAEEGKRIESVAAPNPPPPPPPPPEIEAETPEEELDEEDEPVEEEEQASSRSWVAVVTVGVASATFVPVLALGGWLVVMASLKRRRRRRRTARQPPESVAGAWFELTDRLNEAGVHRGQNFSLREQAFLVGAALGDDLESARLAELVDRAAFSRDGADYGDAARAWSDCDALVERLQSSASLPARLRRLASPQALFGKDLLS